MTALPVLCFMNKRIDKISELIKNESIGIIPTDTIYGLVGSAFSKVAVERIYKVKKRDSRKPLIVLICEYKDIRNFSVKISTSEEKILKKIWPGKISVILPIVGNKYQYLHRGTGEIAFRIPKSKLIRNILKKTGPLVAPSANPENLSPAESVKKAREYFGNEIDFYLGGKTGNKPSTLIRFNENKVEILREGAISKSLAARLTKK